ncbi:MAG: hypothetical protein V2I67_08460, partial [Thermoanaerobaculales bacterium]|nr:hypothetical protein [Thermoanaerobaculales bacterium]
MRIVQVLIAVTTAAVCLAEPCGTPVHDWQAGDMGTVFTDGQRFFFGLGSALGVATVDQDTMSLDVGGYSRPFPTTPAYSVVNGSQAIVGAGSVQVLDLSQTGNPITTFEVWPPQGWLIGLRSAGTLAAAYWWDSDFMSSWAEGVMIIDLSDPSQPELIGEIDTPGSEGKIQMTPDSFLYLFQERLWVYDLSQPEAPALVAETDRPGWKDLVAADGDTVIVRSSDGQLLFVDFADPTSPEVVATYQPAARAKSVQWIAGTLVMVVDGGYGNDDSLEIVDVSTATPTRVSFSEGFFDGSLSDFTCTSEFCLAVEGDSASPDRLRIADIKDPALPTLGDSVSFPSRVVDLAASGSTVAAADRDGRLWMLDLGPDGQTDQRLVTGVEASRVDRQGNTVFAGVVLNRYLDEKSYRLQVVDAGPGVEPEVVGELEVALPDYSIGEWLQAVGDGWVAIAYDQRYSDRLELIDVSDPSRPVLTSTVRLSFGPKEAAAAGDLVALTDGYRRLAVVDVSDSANSALVGSIELDVWADRVAAWGRYVFAVGQDEVVVIDAGNPRQPEPI